MNSVAMEDREGKFGVPEVMLDNDSVVNRMDQKHPHHPLYVSEKNYHKNKEEAELEMLRRTMGIAMPLKLQMEKKFTSVVGHLPCISTRSNASYEALLGIDSDIGFDDIMSKPENFENMTALPFNLVEKHFQMN
uniref:Proteasome maturation protein n=1 Tax=Pseudodiaptomus poplesia TaxID=213370 RepID=A0A1S6GLD4_9MAXI|nr:proteasome maturation protein [Pseudodiaptomus poplesia]